MRGAIRSIQLLLLASLAAVSPTAAQVKPAPDAEGIVGEAPAYRVGDEWRFTGGRLPGVVRVVAVEPDRVVTEFSGDSRCRACRYVRDRNLTVLGILDSKGDPWPDAILGEKRLDFPLRVGKEWTQYVDLRSTSGAIQPYFNRFRVEAYETVTVPAGTLKAFRISQFQENRTSRWTGTATSWWSPEIRWWVKFESLRATGLSRESTRRDTELQSYSLK